MKKLIKKIVSIMIVISLMIPSMSSVVMAVDSANTISQTNAETSLTAQVKYKDWRDFSGESMVTNTDSTYNFKFFDGDTDVTSYVSHNNSNQSINITQGADNSKLVSFTGACYQDVVFTANGKSITINFNVRDNSNPPSPPPQAFTMERKTSSWTPMTNINTMVGQPAQYIRFMKNGVNITENVTHNFSDSYACFELVDFDGAKAYKINLTSNTGRTNIVFTHSNNGTPETLNTFLNVTGNQPPSSPFTMEMKTGFSWAQMPNINTMAGQSAQYIRFMKNGVNITENVTHNFSDSYASFELVDFEGAKAYKINITSNTGRTDIIFTHSNETLNTFLNVTPSVYFSVGGTGVHNVFMKDQEVLFLMHSRGVGFNYSEGEQLDMNGIFLNTANPFTLPLSGLTNANGAYTFPYFLVHGATNGPNGLIVSNYDQYAINNIQSVAWTSSNPNVIANGSVTENCGTFALQVLSVGSTTLDFTITFNDGANQAPLHANGLAYNIVAEFTGNEVDVDSTMSSEMINSIINSAPPSTETSDTAINFAPGVYPVDLNISNLVSLRQKPNTSGTVILQGSTDTNTPILTYSDGATAGFINGITFDGSTNNKKVGINSLVGDTYLTDVTITNCTETGVQGRNVNLESCTITNCGTAVKQIASLGFNIQNSTIKNNTIGLSISGTYSTVGSLELITDVILKANVFDNTTNIINDGTSITSGKFSFTQNYFGGDNLKITGFDGNAYTSPYFMDEGLTRLNADINTVKVVGNTYTMDTDLTIGNNYELQKDTFEDLKVQTGKSVEITLQDNKNNTKQTTAVWNFAQDTLLAAPSGMNLDVNGDISAQGSNMVNALPSAEKSKVLQEVNFVHNGHLPGKATVKILADSVPDDVSDLKLYYLNTSTNKMELAEVESVTTENIDGKTYYVIVISHCSEYVITSGIIEVDEETPVPPTPTPTPSPDVTPVPTIPQAPTDTTPSTSTDNTSDVVTSNDITTQTEIENKFENSNSNEIIIDVEVKQFLSSAAFTELKNHPEKTLILEGDSYSWKFKSSNLNGNNFTQTMDTKISLTSPNADIIKQLTGDNTITNVYFNHHGNLPANAEITVNLGKYHSQTMYLYYYNAQGNIFEYKGIVNVDDSGNAIFEISHCSDYILSETLLENAVNNPQEVSGDTDKDEVIVNDNKENIVEENEKVTTPTVDEDNSSSLPIILIIVGVAITLIITILIIKKAKSNK